MADAPPKRVLVVLDDDAFAARVHEVIEQAGYRPFLARNASEAHALLDKQLDPCVILFSLTSSNDGREFLARHGARAGSAEIPVIFFPGAHANRAAGPIVSALVAFVQTHCEVASAKNGSSALH
jgi:PleD family two-component response regulator